MFVDVNLTSKTNRFFAVMRVNAFPHLLMQFKQIHFIDKSAFVKKKSKIILLIQIKMCPISSVRVSTRILATFFVT